MKKQSSISSFFTSSLPVESRQKKQQQQPSPSSSRKASLPVTNTTATRAARATANTNPSTNTNTKAYADTNTSVYTDTKNTSSIPSRKRSNVDINADDDDDNDAAQTFKRQRSDTSSSPTLKNTSTDVNGQLNAGPSATGKGNYKRLGAYAHGHDKFMNNLSDAQSTNDTVDEEQARQRRAMLHAQFVSKLGDPDSLMNLRRRNNVLTAEEEDLSDQGEEEGYVHTNGVDEKKLIPEQKKGSTAVTNQYGKALGSRASSAKKKHKLTPMEQQIIDIKRKHMDTLLVVEVGYKYRFFGEDARIAAKELSIVCIPGKYRFDEHPSEAHLDRFASASIPVHRLHVHVKRLVAAGHKVGVVRQLETAALKAAGDNRNTPFVRKLTNLYTKGTYIDDVETLDAPSTGPGEGAPATGHLLCLTETNAKGWGSDEKVHVGIVAVQPATGDIIYDDFEDGFMRSEIETRLLHIAPCEFLIVGELSRATEKLVQHLSGSKTNVFGDKARVERVERPKNMAAMAFEHIQRFYASDKLKGSLEENILGKVHNLSEHVTMCLSAMITHLTDYGLEHVFDLTKNFEPFSVRSHMLLNGNTLASLEIYQNQNDYSERGSLFWVLDQTQTRFGQRMLRKWVGRPLLDQGKLEERINAVEELKAGEKTVLMDKLQHLLSKVRGDLEKSLLRIYYKKCSRPELLNVLQTLQRIATEYAHVKGPQDAGFDSPLISSLITALPLILDDVIEALDKINPSAAQQDDKYTFFREEHETDTMAEHKAALVAIEEDFSSQLAEAAAKLKRGKAEYTTVAGIDYLIEVDNGNIKNVPASWTKISGTKKVSRFHTPEVVRLIRERDQHKEALAAACDAAFIALLTSLSSHYQSFRDAILSLAQLDCLLSLAAVASRPGYCKPAFSSSSPLISIQDGRHPMVEQLLLDAYVPNSLTLSPEERAVLITGPNMGGKSSLVRQTALISIMGQIGSYVPATSATLGLLDAVFTRMGAMDNIAAGESTFMVELSETADILKQATKRSLVILDELGRGTSTHDGVSIAGAVLDWFLRETGALVLFVTHYQSLATVQANFPDGMLRNMHMSFSTASKKAASAATVTGTDEEDGKEKDGKEEEEEITFLYELVRGTAHRSYGLNVARLAHVPRPVLDTARQKSRELELEVQHRRLTSLAASLCDALSHSGSGSDSNGRGDGRGDLRIEELVEGIETL